MVNMSNPSSESKLTMSCLSVTYRLWHRPAISYCPLRLHSTNRRQIAQLSSDQCKRASYQHPRPAQPTERLVWMRPCCSHSSFPFLPSPWQQHHQTPPSELTRSWMNLPASVNGWQGHGIHCGGTWEPVCTHRMCQDPAGFYKPVGVCVVPRDWWIRLFVCALMSAVHSCFSGIIGFFYIKGLKFAVLDQQWRMHMTWMFLKPSW